jgi:signal transduction histidine kinase
LELRTTAAAGQVADCGLQICCDGLAIQQALVNLLDNAIKHSPGGEKILVGLELSGKSEHRTPNVERPTSNFQIWVEDHGPGIPPEEHEKIFERFYRRGSELRRETQGIGIGLTIVKHIVEGHGGKVVVRSAVGEGSSFTIELPTHLTAENAKNT